MSQKTIYRHEMEKKMHVIGEKINLLEQKTVHSYSTKRGQILERIMRMKKERQQLVDQLAELHVGLESWEKKKNEIEKEWHDLKHLYNTSVLLMEEVMEKK